MNIRNLAALCATFALVACSSPLKHEPAELKSIENPIDVNEVWSTSVGSSKLEFLMPAVVGDAVYAAGSNSVYKLNAENGDTVWDFDADDKIAAGVGSDGTAVAFGTVKGELVVVGADNGQKLWSQFLTAEMNAVPLVGHGMVIVRTADTRVTAFDAMTGTQLWRYQAQVPTLTLKSASQMRFFQNVIVVGENSGHLLALTYQGQPVWRFLVSEAKGTTEVERLVDVLGAPMVEGDLLCTSVYQGRLVCINASDGRFRFTADVKALTPPVIGEKAVFVGNADSEIYAFERVHGQPLWKSDDLKYRGVRAMVYFAGVLAVTDSEGYIHIVNPDNGQIIGRTDLSGAIVSVPQPYGYGAIFQSNGGEVAYLKVF